MWLIKFEWFCKKIVFRCETKSGGLASPVIYKIIRSSLVQLSTRSLKQICSYLKAEENNNSSRS